MVRLVLSRWELHNEGRPRPDGALELDAAAVLVNDLAHDGQSEPRARGLGREEGREDAGSDLLRHPLSRVREADLDVLARGKRRQDEGAASRHRLDRVAIEV